jgi:hypothetical protein
MNARIAPSYLRNLEILGSKFASTGNGTAVWHNFCDNAPFERCPSCDGLGVQEK